MKTELYDKYYDVLIRIKNVMNITTNEKLKELSKNTIINTVNQLCEADKNNKEIYEGILVEFSLKEENKLNNDTNELENDLPEILEKKNDIEENIVEEDIKEELDKDNSTKVIEENKKDNSKTLKKEEEKNNINDKYKEAEEYVLNNIYRSKNTALGDKFQNIMIDLIKSLKNKNQIEITECNKRYKEFIEENKSVINEEILNNYLKFITFEYSDSKNEEKTDETNEKRVEGFKIKKIKKSFNSKLKNRALSLLALSGIGLANPLFAVGIGIGGYYLYKKGIKNARNIIERNGLSVDKDDNLIDSNNKVVTKEDIGKLKYNLVKRELSKNNDKLGRIDISYKKNKLTSMLLNAPIVKTIKSKYQEIKANNTELSEDANDINKGMGIIK